MSLSLIPFMIGAVVIGPLFLCPSHSDPLVSVVVNYDLDPRFLCTLLFPSFRFRFTSLFIKLALVLIWQLDDMKSVKIPGNKWAPQLSIY